MARLTQRRCARSVTVAPSGAEGREGHTVGCRCDSRSSDLDPATLGRAHAGDGPLPAEITLKLRDAAEHVEEEPARGCARVDRLISTTRSIPSASSSRPKVVRW